jgi:ABC-type amino acid transport system permease subunit
MANVLLDLLPRFLLAFTINLQISMFALLGGILIGLPLTWLCICGGLVGKVSEFAIALLRAVPVYVLMFVLLNFFSEELHTIHGKL